MAKQMATKNNTDVAEQIQLNMFADSGAGMEGASSEAFAIPFLSVLQKGSPQVDEASGRAIEGAKSGMLYENVSGRFYDGKAGLTLVPCAYRRVFLHWASRANGGGFRGELQPEKVAEMRARGQICELDGRLYIPSADGTVSDKNCDRISDTRNHYVLIVDRESGAWNEALLSLSSSQIKKSKMLMSALASVRVSNPMGNAFCPPTFGNYVKVMTTPESNDKGNWFGIKFELAGSVDRAEVYAAAKAFHASVAQGGVVSKYAEETAPEPNDAF